MAPPHQPDLLEIFTEVTEGRKALEQARDAIRVSSRHHSAQVEAQKEVALQLNEFALASSTVETNNQLRHKTQIELAHDIKDAVCACVNAARDMVYDAINAQTGVIQSKMTFDGKSVEMVKLEKKGRSIFGIIRVDGEEIHFNRSAVAKAWRIVRRYGPIPLAIISGVVGRYWHVIWPAIKAAHAVGSAGGH